VRSPGSEWAPLPSLNLGPLNPFQKNQHHGAECTESVCTTLFRLVQEQRPGRGGRLPNYQRLTFSYRPRHSPAYEAYLSVRTQTKSSCNWETRLKLLLPWKKLQPIILLISFPRLITCRFYLRLRSSGRTRVVQCDSFPEWLDWADSCISRGVANILNRIKSSEIKDMRRSYWFLGYSWIKYGREDRCSAEQRLVRTASIADRTKLEGGVASPHRPQTEE